MNCDMKNWRKNVSVCHHKYNIIIAVFCRVLHKNPSFNINKYCLALLLYLQKLDEWWQRPACLYLVVYIAAFHLKFCHILQNVSRFRNISFLITEMHYTPTNTISKLLSSELKKVQEFLHFKKKSIITSKESPNNNSKKEHEYLSFYERELLILLF